MIPRLADPEVNNFAYIITLELTVELRNSGENLPFWGAMTFT